LCVSLGGPAEGGQEHDALAGGVRGEEFGHVVVEERESRGTEPQSVRAEIQLAAEDRRFELGRGSSVAKR
jgi:hypothetical protein